ncbi:MFS transporter [Streptosporangium sp. NBC_01495]|uniref:MFS transporter n=1 Tax=Streptosporangium sp. NBC_01495 TaxID=2903899 RepID=UPI002E3811B9|nr:MFS transporter [Streptosporangium sp. NBC_01495]
MTTVMTDEPPAGIFARSHRALTVGMVALISLAAFEYLAVATAMPVVADELDGHALYGLAFSGALAAGVIATVLGGWWGDLRGPVAPLWTGVAIFAVGLVVAGVAPTMDVFVAGRFVQGFGAGILQVSMYVLVSRSYPAELHPRVFSIFATAWVVPSMVGPAITGVVVENAGWRWVFIGVTGILLPAALLLWRGLASAPMAKPVKEPTVKPVTEPISGAVPVLERPSGLRSSITRRLGWALLVAAGAALMQYGASALTQSGDTVPGTGFVLLAAGLAMLVAALPRLLPPGTLRAARGLPSVISLRGIAAGAAIGGEAFLPLMLNEERGLSLTMAGLTLTGGALSWSFGSWVVGRRRFDRVRVLRSGSVLIAVGLALMGLTVFAVVPVATAFLGEMALGLGMGIVYPTLSVLILELSPPGEEGENSASLGVAESVYTVVAVAVTGALLAALGASVAVYVLCFGLTALMAATGALVSGRVLPRV